MLELVESSMVVTVELLGMLELVESSMVVTVELLGMLELVESSIVVTVELLGMLELVESSIVVTVELLGMLELVESSIVTTGTVTSTVVMVTDVGVELDELDGDVSAMVVPTLVSVTSISARPTESSCAGPPLAAAKPAAPTAKPSVVATMTALRLANRACRSAFRNF
jgi:hypothetical protein